MNIGEAEKASGLPAKTIRYYEEIDLVVPQRRANGYRDYDPANIHKLQFLGRARSLGFSIRDCRALLALYDDRDRASAEVKQIAEEHLRQIDEKIAGLSAMQDTLSKLVTSCAGDNRPDCPILEDLGGAGNGRESA